MNKILLKTLFIMFILYLQIGNLIGQDFTVKVPSTNDYSGYIKPLKAGGSIQFQITVTNNRKDTCNVSIDIASMGTVPSWVSSDPTSITVFPAQVV